MPLVRVCACRLIRTHGAGCGEGSGNEMGRDGWGAVMAAAEGCSALEELSGVEWRAMLGGGLKTLDLGGKRDEGLAVACATRYLGRSASCLTELNMRCPTKSPASTKRR